MKLETVTLKNFKRFKSLTVDIKNRTLNEVADQFLILGDNGTGKTTVLQAIALCLSMVSHKTRSVHDFDWMGWVPGRYFRWGTPFVELTVHFTGEEIVATQEAARRWYESRPDFAGRAPYVEPPHSNIVRVSLEGERYTTGKANEQFLFGGRSYAASLLNTDAGARDLFEHLPGIFWFDQFRNLATPPGAREVERDDQVHEEPSGRISYAVGVAQLREHLNKWKLARVARGLCRGGTTSSWIWKTFTRKFSRVDLSATLSRSSEAGFPRHKVITSRFRTARELTILKKCHPASNRFFQFCTSLCDNR
jgi:AAA ATPase domain